MTDDSVTAVRRARRVLLTHTEVNVSVVADPPVAGPSFETRIRRLLAVLLVGVLVVAAGGVVSAWALSDAADDVDRVEEAREALAGIREGLVDQQTGVRGFVIAGEEPFLETYGPGGALADASRARLSELAPEVVADGSLTDLDEAIVAWRDVADRLIGLVRSGRSDDAVAIVESGFSKQQFDVVRTYLGDLQSRLDDAIDARNRRQADLVRSLAVVGIGVLIVSLAAIVGLLRWLRRSVTVPLARLAGAVGEPDGRPFAAFADDAAGEVAAIARSADRLRTTKDLERNAAVLVAEQTERRRVAADLHDGPVQSLFALQLRLQHAVRRPSGEVPSEALADAIDVLERTQTDLRSLMVDLAPPGLGDRPLADVLASVVAGAVDPGTRVDIDVPDDLDLPHAVQLVVCRVTAESVRNVRRHAAAGRVLVRMRRAGASTTLEVVDDGTGFEPGTAADVGHFGLGIMRSLAESIGATLDVVSAPGHGTTVRMVTRRGSVEVDDPVADRDHDRLEL